MNLDWASIIFWNFSYQVPISGVPLYNKTKMQFLFIIVEMNS